MRQGSWQAPLRVVQSTGGRKPWPESRDRPTFVPASISVCDLGHIHPFPSSGLSGSQGVIVQHKGREGRCA